MLSLCAAKRSAARVALSSRAVFASFVRFNSTQSQPTPAPSKPKFTSIAPAGTPLKGLNILKGQDNVVALADEEYPDWLWEVLDKGAQRRKLDANPARKAQKARRLANREQIKEKNFLASMTK